jgi:hypothetical protein
MVQPIGYFRLWRELYIKPIWLKSTVEQKVILMTILAMANYKCKQWEWNGKKFQVEPGQCITSINSIMECCGNGISRQNVRTSLERFRKLEFLTYESTKTGILITIGNWELYQGNGEQPNHQTNHDLTITQPSANHDLTTREERKKDKKVKNKTIVDFSTEINSYTQDQELIKTINDFVEHRKSIDRPIKTANTLKLLFKELDKHQDKIGVLEQSILRGWTGIFELNQKKDAKQTVKEGISPEIMAMYEDIRKPDEFYK